MSYVTAFVGGVILFSAGVIAEREGFLSSVVMIFMGGMYLYVLAIPEKRRMNL